MTKEFTDRAAMLLGSDTMKRLEETKIIVFGVGGVGSWCVESLVRTGVGHVTIVDSDCVCASNANRQMMATSSTVGRVKVDALRERLLDINPCADVKAIRERFCEETAGQFCLDDYDYVIDCIDSLADKALLILKATSCKTTLFSSMGAALKLDPGRIEVADFWKVKGCPLARALRNRFKKRQEFPRRKFKCVYSDELVPNKMESINGERANGSLMHITAVFGLTLASLVIRHVTSSE